MPLVWKTGDVVQLKSGGPKMTVVRLPGVKDIPEDKIRYIQCQWFDNAGVLQTQTFHIEAVDLYKEEVEQSHPFLDALQQVIERETDGGVQ